MSDDAANRDLIDALIIELEQRDVALPSLPEIALKVRTEAESPQTDAVRLARVISTDPALTGRVIHAANSAIFAGLNKATSVQSAIMRLGINCVKNMAISLAMVQLFQGRQNPFIREKLLEVWNHSTFVAAIGQVLAADQRHLDNSEALLAGLLHNIGALPVIQRCASMPQFLESPHLLDLVMSRVQEELGCWILQQWNFASHLVAIPALVFDLERHHEGPADYADVVTVANLLAGYNADGEATHTNWEGVAAFDRLGLTPERGVDILYEAHNEIHDIQQLLKS